MGCTSAAASASDASARALSRAPQAPAKTYSLASDMADAARAEGEPSVGPAVEAPIVEAAPGTPGADDTTAPSAGAAALTATTQLCDLSARINNLKRVQTEMFQAKKKAAAELRNLERKRGRLAKKARLLSDDDLLLVLKLRQEKAQDKAASSASSSGAGTSEASSPPEEGR